MRSASTFDVATAISESFNTHALPAQKMVTRQERVISLL